MTSLTQENRTVAHVHYDWHWISESAARSAMQRLYRRGFVDVAGFEGSARTYGITRKGLEALDGNLVDSDA